MLINSLGAFTLPFLAFFLARKMHLSATAIGAILTGFGAGSLLAAMNAGWISDRYGRRRVLLACQLATASTTASFAVVRDVDAFALLVFVFGVAINVPNPVLRALVADLVTVENHARAYATIGSATTLAALSRWATVTDRASRRRLPGHLGGWSKPRSKATGRPSTNSCGGTSR